MNYNKTKINELLEDYSTATDERRKSNLLIQLEEFMPNAKDIFPIIERHYVTKKEFENLKREKEEILINLAEQKAYNSLRD